MPIFKRAGLLLLGLSLLTACASYLDRVSQGHDPQSYLLKGAHLITMESPGLQEGDILVQNQKIVAMGTNLQAPASAKVLNLTGKYILPGFSDMHTHISHERDLLLYLRHGITQVRNMADSHPIAKLLGIPDVLVLREKVNSGKILGPGIFACGPILDGKPPSNALIEGIDSHAGAEKAVLETYKKGFDCVKVYNRLKKEHFETIVKTAKRLQIPVMGHVPFSVGLDGAFQTMVTQEHLNGYVENFAGHYRVPESELPEYAIKTAQANMYNCPTLVNWDSHPPRTDFESKWKADPRYQWISFTMREFWKITVPYMYEITYPDPETYAKTIFELSKPVVKILYENKAPLLIGTDANLPGVYPGSSALREMELFAEAGLPPQAILEAATVNAARVLNKIDRSGTLAVNKYADMVVLDKNPLKDIRHVQSTYGVMTRGRWLTTQTLDQMLQGSIKAAL